MTDCTRNCPQYQTLSTSASILSLITRYVAVKLKKQWRDGSRSYRDRVVQPEFAILAHSHLLVQHLLKQLEQHKRERESRSHRPEWLSVLVHQAAAMLEPLSGVGRVGSQCEFVDDQWEVRMYLGATEIVGGKNDGHSQFIGFGLNLSGLSQLFTQVDEFEWTVAASASNSSFILLNGSIDENPVRLKVYSRPPREAGPAFRQLADGSMESVS